MAVDVTFHNLTNNPGLLPLKLGNSQNVINTWSFIHIYDISPIIREFTSLQNSLNKILLTLNKSSIYKQEFYNSYNLACVLENKIKSQINQINPLSTSNRFKRGLINGLGSIIKSLTGNLDQQDAEKYDKIISTIYDNDNNLKTAMQEQITIIENSNKYFREVSENLTHNQILLESRVLQVQTAMRNMKENVLETKFYFTTQMLISQVTTSFQEIYDLLEKLQVAITFSKLNTFHNSILDPNELLDEIQSITDDLVSGKLPFFPSKENILLFEKILQIKSYSKGNQVVFIIELPIVESTNYILYHLYPLPTPSSNNFKIIFPQTKYLILNELKHASFDHPCEEISPEEYLCRNANLLPNNDEAPCEVQMLNFSPNTSKCHHTMMEVERTKVEKLEHEKWMLIIPQQTVAVQQCGSNKDNIPLKGTYLLELTPSCEVHISDFHLKTYHSAKVSFKNIELPQINLPAVTEESLTFKFDKTNLNSINLNEFDNIQNAIDTQNQKLKNILKKTNFFFEFNLSTLLIYVLLIALAVFYLYKKVIEPKLRRKKKEDPEAQDAEVDASSILSRVVI